MRSCSPSLRVVPSYLINLTKDRANIFSDLSFAEEQGKESHLRMQRLYIKKCKTKFSDKSPYNWAKYVKSILYFTGLGWMLF